MIKDSLHGVRASHGPTLPLDEAVVAVSTDRYVTIISVSPALQYVLLTKLRKETRTSIESDCVASRHPPKTYRKDASGGSSVCTERLVDAFWRCAEMLYSRKRRGNSAARLKSLRCHRPAKVVPPTPETTADRASPHTDMPAFSPVHMVYSQGNAHCSSRPSFHSPRTGMATAATSEQ